VTDTVTNARIARRPGMLLVFVVLAVLMLCSTAAIASAAAKTTTWTGAADLNWSNSSNWDNGVPVNGDNVVLPSLPEGNTNYPVNNDLGTALVPLSLNTLTIDCDVTGFYYTVGGKKLVIGAGGIVDTGTAATDILAVPVVFSSTRTVQVTQSGHNLNILGSGISGSGGVTKTGSGTLIYQTPCTYSGTTTVTEGVLQLSTDNAVPYDSGKGNVFVDSAGTVLMYSDTSMNGLSGSGAVKAGGNSWLTVGCADATSTFSGSMQDDTGILSVLKTGSGTFTLSGTGNTYSGPTYVTAGAMCVTGSASSSAFTVQGGATLSGTGTVGGMTLPATGDTGTVSPGSTALSVGTLHTAGETWDDGGTYNVDIADTTSADLLSASGAIDVAASGGGFTVKVASTTSKQMYDFDPSATYYWLIAQGTSVTSFDEGDFAIDTSGFDPAQTPTGTWSVTQNGTSDKIYLKYSGQGTAVVIKSFRARVRHGRVQVVWRTASQAGTAGFFLERRNSKTGHWKRVNRALLPVVRGAGGATYRLTDAKARPGRRTTYRLVEVRVGRGPTHICGPYTVVPRRG
jgi:autotransporter-associated beta strand protein